MDLHDFRRQWQQQPTPAAEPLPTTEQAFRAMLTSQANPVHEIERSVQRDQRLLLVAALLNLFNIGNMIRRHPGGLNPTSQTVLYVLVAGLVLFLGWYFHHLNRAIRQLRRTDKPTFGHIHDSIRQIRALMRSRLNVVLIFLGLVGLTILYGRSEFILRSWRAGTLDWGLTALLLLGMGGLLGLLVVLGRLKQQRRYGRYLDQLEGALRELEETK